MFGRCVAANSRIRRPRLPIALALALCFAPLVVYAAAPDTPCVGAEGDRLEDISGARVPFQSNTGQLSDSSVMFFARTFGGTVYVTSEGRIIYALPKFDSCPNAPAGDDAPRRQQEAVFSQRPLWGPRRGWSLKARADLPGM